MMPKPNRKMTSSRSSRIANTVFESNRSVNFRRSGTASNTVGSPNSGRKSTGANASPCDFDSRRNIQRSTREYRANNHTGNCARIRCHKDGRGVRLRMTVVTWATSLAWMSETILPIQARQIQSSSIRPIRNGPACRSAFCCTRPSLRLSSIGSCASPPLVAWRSRSTNSGDIGALGFARFMLLAGCDTRRQAVAPAPHGHLVHPQHARRARRQ